MLFKCGFLNAGLSVSLCVSSFNSVRRSILLCTCPLKVPPGCETPLRRKRKRVNDEKGKKDRLIMYISCHVSWLLLFAIACLCHCIIMYFKCLKMLFWINCVIFFLKKEVVAIVNVFMYWRRHSFELWRMLCNLRGRGLFVYVYCKPAEHSTYISDLWGHIFQKSPVALEPMAMRCWKRE